MPTGLCGAITRASKWGDLVRKHCIDIVKCTMLLDYGEVKHDLM